MTTLDQEKISACSIDKIKRPVKTTVGEHLRSGITLISGDKGQFFKRVERVGGFPVSEGNWYDIGQWDEHKRTLDFLNVTEGRLC